MKSYFTKADVKQAVKGWGGTLTDDTKGREVAYIAHAAQGYRWRANSYAILTTRSGLTANETRMDFVARLEEGREECPQECCMAFWQAKRANRFDYHVERQVEQIDGLYAAIEVFSQKVLKHPVRAFAWSRLQMEQAAELAERAAILGIYFLVDQSIQARTAAAAEHLEKAVLRGAKYPISSTSWTSDLMEVFKLQAQAMMLEEVRELARRIQLPGGEQDPIFSQEV